jgi:hypothetical protein
LPPGDPAEGAPAPARRNVGPWALALFAYGLALLLPPSAPFAATALPALAGEALARRGLRRWPRIAVLVGALLVWGYVALLAIVVSLCGLGDEVSRACERTAPAATPMAWCFGSAAVVLTVLACAWPGRRALRYALWSTPALMVATFAVIATL